MLKCYIIDEIDILSMHHDLKIYEISLNIM